MHFDVMSGIPSLAGNALKGGDRTAAERQTPFEHDSILDEKNLPEYPAVLMMPAGPQRDLALNALKAEAMRREADLPKYWNDQYPRRPITQSSSWISGIEYDPVTNYAQMQTRDGKTYGYGGIDPTQMANIINSQSIGDEFNKR
jgi:hypothetical protein